MANLCPYGDFAPFGKKVTGVLGPNLIGRPELKSRVFWIPIKLQIDSCGELSMHINDVRNVCILRAMEGHRAFFGQDGFLVVRDPMNAGLKACLFG